MGYRTLVVLNNDLMGHWQNDPHLGKGIASAAAGHRDNRVGDYGSVLQSVNADTQSLLVVDSLSAVSLATSSWVRGEESEAVALKLLKEAADKLGYTLHRKPQK